MPPLFSFLSALARGATLGEAMQRSELSMKLRLRDALLFIFSEGLVISVAPRA